MIDRKNGDKPVTFEVTIGERWAYKGRGQRPQVCCWGLFQLHPSLREMDSGDLFPLGVPKHARSSFAFAQAGVYLFPGETNLCPN